MRVPSDADDGTVDNVATVESETPDSDLTDNTDDAAPTTTLPPATLPKTGSDATGGIVQGAFLFLLLGLGVMLVARRRDESTAAG